MEGPKPSHDGKHRNLKKGTESRVQIADALGKEIHHPLMSKLWNTETGPKDRQTQDQVSCITPDSRLNLLFLKHPLALIN